MVQAVGIDLGTTKSVIGVWQNGECHIIRDNVGHQSIPSLVVVTADERILAGRQAQKHPDRYAGKNITISSVKRLMGRKGETGWGWWKAYPQEVSAFILAELKSQAESYLGEEIKQAVIAIPSHFDEAQRRATKEAAEIAGLKVIRLLNEATAAVLAYGLHRHGDETCLVFDFGGGTLDISIVGLGGEGIYQVKSIEGDSKLGGDDFDQVVLDYVLDRVHQ
jgi:molecular chaperone DnaK